MKNFYGEHIFETGPRAPDNTHAVSEEIIERFVHSGEGDENRPKMDDFVSKEMYSAEKVAADKRALAARIQENAIASAAQRPALREFQEQQEKLAKALEVIVFRAIELNNWFSQGAMVIPTTAYDDVMHGVDAVIEFGEDHGNKRFALAVDVAMQGEPKRIAAKLEANIHKLLRPNDPKFPAVVEYFESQRNPGERLRLENIIHVVIGADPKHTQQFIRLCADLEELESLPLSAQDEKTKDERTLRKLAITNHPLQVAFLEQIRLQLELYEIVLDRADYPRDALPVGEVSYMLKLIKEILKEKTHVREQSFLVEDHFFAQLAELITRMKEGHYSAR